LAARGGIEIEAGLGGLFDTVGRIWSAEWGEPKWGKWAARWRN
jgi:hypothetical protein